MFLFLSPNTDLPTIISLTYEEENCTLTCVSTGSPPTVVSWMKDGENITIDGHHFSLSQTITDRVSSTYNNTLTVGEGVTGGVAGVYNCAVSNVLGSDSTMIAVVAHCECNIIHCQFNPSVVFSCITPLSIAIISVSQPECSPLSNTQLPTNSSSTSSTEISSVTTADRCTGDDSSSTTTAIIEGVVAIVLIIVVAVVIIALLVLKKAGKKYAVLTNEAKESRIFIFLLQVWSLRRWYTNLHQ